MSDAASRLMFKLRSGTHGLKEELGRHREREGMKECLLCDNECESVSHVLWECPAYSSLRDNILVALQGILGDEFEHFQSLGSFEKASSVLGSENKCGCMLDPVKSYILDVWELRIAPGELQGVAGRGGELCLEGETDTGISVCSLSVCSSVCLYCVFTFFWLANSSGCVVNGSSAAMAAS